MLYRAPRPRQSLIFPIASLLTAGASLTVAFLCACGGNPFSSATQDPLDGSPTDGAITRETSSYAEASDDLSCGNLRQADSPEYNREVCVGAGAFTMGMDTFNLGEPFADHTPKHQVTLPQFAIDAYEVTVRRYAACVDQGACHAPDSGSYETWGKNDLLPVSRVTWQEAHDFCAWDGNRRLPTEAEWEYVTRGPQARAYPWGDQFDCKRAVLGGLSKGPCPEYAGSTPRVVGTIPEGRSADGVYDLVGNVGEWVADYYQSYKKGALDNPTGPLEGTLKVVRGGNWANPISYGLGYARQAVPRDTRAAWGFRCARTP